jgi:hypothetical protein
LAAALVDIEYYDGWDSILNARFFTGQVAAYTTTRAPLMGLLLVPGEVLRRSLWLGPLAVGPFHLVTAVAHLLFFVGTYVLLVRACRRGWPVWLAFVAAVPSFVVFSYAPFVSHDILPGVLLLGMVWGVARHLDRPSWVTWLALVLAGAAAPLLKYTFALFWMAVLAGTAIVLRFEGRARPARRLAGLFAGALASAVLVWLVVCLTAGSAEPGRPFLLRAVRPVIYLLHDAHQSAQVEPWWVYVRNLPAYGIAAALLIVPGLVASWRAGGASRLAVPVWLVLVAAHHAMPVRQVRYLAFLGPLTALLVVPVVVWMLRDRRWTGALVLMLLVDWLPVQPYGNLKEASRVFLPFYRRSAERAFLAYARDSAGKLRTPFLMNRPTLSFVPGRRTPLAGDVYHDVFHLGIQQIDGLFGLRPGEIVLVDQEERQRIVVWPDTAVLIMITTEPVVNDTGWRRRPERNRAELRQYVLVPRTLTVRRGAEGWALPGGLRVVSRPQGAGGRAGFRLGGADLVAAMGYYVMPRAQVPGAARPLVLSALDSGELRVPLEEDSVETLDLHFFQGVVVLVQDDHGPRLRRLGEGGADVAARRR